MLYELQPGPQPWPKGREAQVYHEACEQVVLAEELGFDYIWAVEHHGLTGYSSSSAPETFLSWVAGKTSRIRIGHGVVQTNKGTNHLVRVAEKAAALDIISNGRLEFGTGRGFTHEELGVFGVNPDDTRPMQEHAMRNLPKMWAEEYFELDDELYQVPRRRLHPRPVQEPHPPIWMACTQPSSWALAGELGAGVLAFGFAAPGALAEAIKAYRTASADAKTPYGVVTDQIAFAPPMFCALDEREALETAAPAILFFMECNFRYVLQWAETDSKDYEFYKLIGTDILKLPELTEQEKAGLSPQAQTIKAGVKAGLFCVGTPDQCRKFVRGYAEQDVDQLLLINQLGSLTNEQIQRSMRLFGTEVLPEFSESFAAGVAEGGYQETSFGSAANVRPANVGAGAL
jgi:alkanesulfonate monooxygenase SsuD/methylene tetrahydromethanopterin reductase-like flavin-dependent oxidoreductase (luciferase family)